MATFDQARSQKAIFKLGWLARCARSVHPQALETAAILLNVDQSSQLFASLEEVRSGQVVTAVEAFGDL
ncbi:MAG: hypothetical protein SFZ03_10065 [Candidatus Melainabacteria bacterium]|nr:hypothetical protein [Candidatus Melainabacteria bacterium]